MRHGWGPQSSCRWIASRIVWRRAAWTPNAHGAGDRLVDFSGSNCCALVGGEPTCGGLGAGGLQHPEPQLAECDYRDARFVSATVVPGPTVSPDATENGWSRGRAVRSPPHIVRGLRQRLAASPRLVVVGAQAHQFADRPRQLASIGGAA